MEAYRKLKITPNSDGSWNRHLYYPNIPATGNWLPHGCIDPALSKDVDLDKSKHTFIRIFSWYTLPNTKLPVVLYIKGGAFIFLSPASPMYHKTCAKWAYELPALVLSVHYRHAPENRLPAAYDDAVDALLWIRDQARNPTVTWMRQADFSNIFVVGSCTGGNIAFHLGVRALELDLSPIKFSGLIMHQPVFGGMERTNSELSMAEDKVLPLDMTDLMFKLALPLGTNRDHWYCNPMMMRRYVKGLPRCLITGNLGDPMIDRERMLAKMLEEEGVIVVKKLDREGHHGAAFINSDMGAVLQNDVKHFIYQS